MKLVFFEDVQYAIWFESSIEVLFEIVSDANYVIIINNLVLNIPDRRFDCKLADFCCECNTIIKILTNVMIGLF